MCIGIKVSLRSYNNGWANQTARFIHYPLVYA